VFRSLRYMVPTKLQPNRAKMASEQLAKHEREPQDSNKAVAAMT